jgi:hypothetical protein
MVDDFHLAANFDTFFLLLLVLVQRFAVCLFAKVWLPIPGN